MCKEVLVETTAKKKMTKAIKVKEWGAKLNEK